MANDLVNTPGGGNKMTSAQKKKLGILSLMSLIIISLYYFVPYGQYVLYPFTLLSTFVHEMGHGITAVLLGGKFVKFEMYTNAAGVATTRGDFSNLQSALVAAGGLVGPAIMAVVLFVLCKNPKRARIGLMVCAIACILSCVLVVRNLFGFFFVLAVGLICGLGANFLKGRGTQLLLMIGAVTEALAVFTRMDYLFDERAGLGYGRCMPSDVSIIANNLFLPYWFWGGLIAIFSIIVLIIGFKLYVMNTDEPENTKAMK